MADVNTAPSFIERDGNKIITEMIADYQLRTGRTLHPAQAEQLLINSFAFRELLVREQIQQTATQMLVDFAVAPALDYLAALVGVTRLSSSGATTTIEFTFSSGHGALILPANIRVASSDGQAVFATSESKNVDVGVDTVTVEASGQSLGTGDNGYAIGEINDILDPQSFLISASNTTVTAGGSNEETDEGLRQRVKLAPSAFSVAGPTDAYIFHAKSASPAIIDVAVLSTIPGTVHIYPLVAGGVVTPAEIIALVFAACNDKKVRPLTDTVVVESPTVVNYNISVDVQIYTGGDSTAIQSVIEANLAAYAAQRSIQMGRDVQISQIISLAVYDPDVVFDATVSLPAADVVVQPTEVASVGTITVNITNETDG